MYKLPGVLVRVILIQDVYISDKLPGNAILLVLSYTLGNGALHHYLSFISAISVRFMLSFNPTKIKIVPADGLIPYLLSENDNSTTECPRLLALPVKQVQPDCYRLAAGPCKHSSCQILSDGFFSLLMPSLGSSCIRSCLNLFIDETFSHSRLTVATFVCVR